jgi:hypothetical protein
MDQDLRDRYKFFRYTRQLTARWALLYAKAERYAETAGFTFTWASDVFEDLGDHEVWCGEAKRAEQEDRRPRCTHEVVGCMVRDSFGKIRASIWGIIDPDSGLERELEAELAYEAMPGEVR